MLPFHTVTRDNSNFLIVDLNYAISVSYFIKNFCILLDLYNFLNSLVAGSWVNFILEIAKLKLKLQLSQIPKFPKCLAALIGISHKSGSSRADCSNLHPSGTCEPKWKTLAQMVAEVEFGVDEELFLLVWSVAVRSMHLDVCRCMSFLQMVSQFGQL